MRLVSGNDESRCPKGTAVDFNAISGHRGVFETACPGQALHDELPWIRRATVRLRHDATWAGRPARRRTGSGRVRL